MYQHENTTASFQNLKIQLQLKHLLLQRLLSILRILIIWIFFSFLPYTKQIISPITFSQVEYWLDFYLPAIKKLIAELLGLGNYTYLLWCLT